jgi:hypothetical protein
MTVRRTRKKVHGSSKVLVTAEATTTCMSKGSETSSLSPRWIRMIFHQSFRSYDWYGINAPPWLPHMFQSVSWILASDKPLTARHLNTNKGQTFQKLWLIGCCLHVMSSLGPWCLCSAVVVAKMLLPKCRTDKQSNTKLDGNAQLTPCNSTVQLLAKDDASYTLCKSLWSFLITRFGILTRI